MYGAEMAECWRQQVIIIEDSSFILSQTFKDMGREILSMLETLLLIVKAQ